MVWCEQLFRRGSREWLWIAGQEFVDDRQELNSVTVDFLYAPSGSEGSVLGLGRMCSKILCIWHCLPDVFHVMLIKSVIMLKKCSLLYAF